MKKFIKIFLISIGSLIVLVLIILGYGLIKEATMEKEWFDKEIDHNTEEKIISRCKSKSKESIIIWNGTVARTPEMSVALHSVITKYEYVDPDGKKKKGPYANLHMWPTGHTSMPGDKEDDVSRIEVGIGDEFLAGNKKLKVVDLYRGFSTKDTRTRDIVCIEKLEDRILYEKCEKKVNNPIVVKERGGERVGHHELSLWFHNISEKEEYISPNGEKKNSINGNLSICPIKNRVIKEDQSIYFQIGIGDEISAFNKKFKVVDMDKGYENEDYYVSGYICLKEI